MILNKMNKNKFRIWNHKHKQFQEMDLPQSQQQFIGILDKNLREIYERDVVKYFDFYGEQIGEVTYSADSCAYYIDHYPIMNLNIASLEVVGNMVEDYRYNLNGELTKRETIS